MDETVGAMGSRSPVGLSDGSAPSAPKLPALTDQAERLIALGVHELLGCPAEHLTRIVGTVEQRPSRQAGGSALLVPDPVRTPASSLTSHLRLGDRTGFVVQDMTDVDSFSPIDGMRVPDGALYVVDDPQRGDEMRNWSANEALPAIEDAGRSPLTLSEGIAWLLQAPEMLTDGHCFMTIGSRLRRPGGGLDARTPALWISRGTGRDGPERRNAPKVGWCWAGNRHTWLGFASAAGRHQLFDR